MDSYIVNLLHLTDPRNASAAELPSPLSVSGTIFPASSSSSAAGASAKHKAMHTPTATHSSARVNFALGTARGESAYSTSPTMTYSGGGAGGFSESKSYLSPLEEAILSLREQLPHSLSAHEVAIMEKVFPFVANMPMSSKTLGEIVWMVRMSEEELVQVVEKVPYLKIVKKLSV